MKNKTHVLVTGGNGQLGLALKKEAKNQIDIDFYFYDSFKLDITNKNQLIEIIESTTFDYCINLAAYTDVEQAEKEPERAFSVNHVGVKNLVDVLKKTKITLIHISTDYVFDGKKNTPYIEEDKPNPINKYGESKLAGEIIIQQNLEKYYIIRTAWLYSVYGNNFFKTIKTKVLKGEKLYVSKDQKGSPTTASSLSKALIHIILSNKKEYGIFHFSNKGLTNWYIFAKKIIELIDSKKIKQLFEIQEHKTNAKRPENSKLNTLKFENTFDFKTYDWEDELHRLIINQ